MPSSVLAPIDLTAEERAQLVSWTRRRTSAQALAMRSRIVLLAAQGRNNTEIAAELKIHRNVAGKWRRGLLNTVSTACLMSRGRGGRARSPTSRSRRS
jgi:FixJ family two-component response regulator